MEKKATVSGVLPLILIAACGEPGPQFQQKAEAILVPPGVVITTTHPEVAEVNPNTGGTCSGTLIRSHWLMTASHCFAGTGAIDSSGGTVSFTDKNGNPQSAQYTNAYRYTTQPSGYAAVNDMALVRLNSDIPAATILPATISLRYPTTGETVQVVGYGCTDRTTQAGVGTKRMATVSWPTNVLCPGDSGGPLFLSDGTMAGINDAAGDQYGDLVDKKWEIESMIRQLDGNLEYGIDRAGNDITHLTTSSATACKAACTQSASCRAFSYQIAEQTCWLKNGVMPAGFSDDNIAGVPDEYAVGWNSVGNDIASYVSTDPNFCHYTCSNTVSPTRCVAWEVDGNTGRCYVKSAVTPTPGGPNNIMLGILRTPENNTARPGGDYASFSGSNVTDCTVRCAQDSRCQAWGLGNGICNLKSVVSEAIASAGIQSGFRRGLVFFGDYRGSDLSSFTLPGCPLAGDAFCAGNDNPLLRPQVCQAACQTTNGCKAWTMDLTTSICYLKNGIPALVSSPGSITGTNTTALDW